MVNFQLFCLFHSRIMRPIILLFILAISVRSWAQFPVGTRNLTFYDPDRDRNIGTVIHYPAISAGTDTEIAAGSFPVLVFGHGFLMGVTSYNNFRDYFVPRGYILVLPTTEGGFPDHAAFGQDLSFLAEALQTAGTDESSPFFSHVAPRTALMGHSMGGGASVLGSSNNSTIQTMVNFAAAETDPSAIAAANSVAVPSLVFAATADCVTPPANISCRSMKHLVRRARHSSISMVVDIAILRTTMASAPWVNFPAQVPSPSIGRNSMMLSMILRGSGWMPS
jgi:hypothetical protein